MDFPLVLTSQLITETLTFVIKVIQDSYQCPLFLHWLDGRSDLPLLKVVVTNVSTRSNYREKFSQCMKAIAPFLPPTIEFDVLETTTRQVLRSGGLIEPVESDPDKILTECLRIYPENAGQKLDGKLRLEIIEMITESIRACSTEDFIIKFCEESTECFMFRELLQHVIKESTLKDQTLWKLLSCDRKVRRIFYDPFWSDAEDADLIKTLAELSKGRNVRNPFQMELACTATTVLLTKENKQYPLECVNMRIAFWHQMFAKFMGFINNEDIAYDFITNAITQNCNNEVKRTLLYKHILVYGLPCARELRYIFTVRCANIDVLPDISNYIKWDMLESLEEESNAT